MGAELATHSANCMPDSEDWESEDICASKYPLKSITARSDYEVAGKPTVVIFDWDDTLLCSTAVRSHRWAVEELEKLEAAIEMTLRTAMDLGETLIVTNGNRTWVQDSARRFLPGLLPILSQIRVVSARALYEDAYPGDPFMWKHAAFQHLLTEERQFSRGVNLVALGDQLPEIDAARHVTQVIGCSLVKTVKFREAPSVGELLGQLGRVEQMLCEIVQEKVSQDYGMVLRDLPPFCDYLTSTANAWQCLAETECHNGCVDPLMGVKNILSLVA